jgi:hypothetical protein
MCLLSTDVLCSVQFIAYILGEGDIVYWYFFFSFQPKLQELHSAQP